MPQLLLQEIWNPKKFNLFFITIPFYVFELYDRAIPGGLRNQPSTHLYHTQPREALQKTGT